MATVQAQAGWSQHDFGHLSVCKTSYWNHFIHQFVMSLTKVKRMETRLSAFNNVF